MADALWSGRRSRTFNVNDDFNWEIQIDSSPPLAQVIRALNERMELRGAPKRLRLDSGPEFISMALKQWAQQHGATLVYIQPGKPNSERLHRALQSNVPHRNAESLRVH